MKLLSLIFCTLAFPGVAAPAFSQAVTPQSTKPAVNGAKLDDCACESQQLPEVVALVNGIRITKLDLNDVTQKRIKELQQQVIEARKGELDLQINSFLLTAEATKLGMTVAKLLETEVMAKAATPTDAEAQALYEENKSKLNREFKDVKGDLIDYLKMQRKLALAKDFADRLRAAAQITIALIAVTPPANQQEHARVFATVNGKTVTSADIEDSLRPLIFSVQKQVYELRKQHVDLKINDILLEKEASNRGITTKALLEAEIYAKTTTITDADAEKFYNENKARITGEFVELKPQIVEYLKDRAERATQLAFADRLRAAARIQIFLVALAEPIQH